MKKLWLFLQVIFVCDYTTKAWNLSSELLSYALELDVWKHNKQNTNWFAAADLKKKKKKNGGWNRMLQSLDQSEMFSPESPTIIFCYTHLNSSVFIGVCVCVC